MPVIYINNDDIRLNSSSSDKVVVTGNLGVGTTSPAYKLDVSGDIRSATIDLATQGVNVSSYGFLSQTLSGQMTFLGHNVRASNTVNNTALVVNGGWISSLIKQYYNEGITFHTSTTEYAAGATYPLADTERMRITSAGNVGIGTTSPTYKLHVNGEGNGLYVIGANSAPYTQTIASFVYGGNSNSINIENQGGKASFQARDSSSNAMNLHLNPVGGNVGIGTTGPAVSLQVNASTAAIRLEETSASAKRLEFSIDSSAVAKISANQSAQSIAFETVGSERMRITDGGNVGIGTTAPAYKLEVSGSVGVGTNSGQNIIYNSFNDVGALFQRVGSYGEVVRLGRWGVSNSVTLDYPTDGTFAISTNSSERMRITSTGNVGIGTTSPTQLLSVAGNTDLGNSIGSATSSTYTTRLSGYALYYDASNRYGNYGVLLLNADSGWTSSAKRFMITNGYNANRFAIIRSVDATTDPALGYGGSVTSGTVDFEINSAGAATFGSSVTTVGAIQSGGDIIIQNTYPRIQLIDTDHNSDFAIINNNGNFSIYDDTNSSHRLWIDPTGNVGIGTTAPTEKVDIRGVVRVSRDGVNDSGILAFGNYLNGAGYYDNGIFRSALNAITTSGNTLHMSSYEALAFTTSPHALGSQTIRMYIPASTGNVGIGTTSPATKLHVFTTSNSDQELLRLTVAPANSSGAKPKAILGFYTPAEANTENYPSGRITSKFDVAGYANSRVTIESLDSVGNFLETLTAKNGNVGIDTTSPSYRLDVSGVTRFQDIVRFKANVWQISDNDAQNRLYFGVGGRTYFGSGDGYEWRSSGDTALAVLTNTGSVGIGTTSPSVKLQVETGADGRVVTFKGTAGNTTDFGFDSVGSYIETLGASSGRQKLRIQTYNGSAYTQLFIDGANQYIYTSSNVNVGIGTTAPVSALSVVGKTNLGSQASGFYVTPSTLHIASSTVSQISFEDYVVTAAIAIAGDTFAFGHQNASPSYEFKYSNTYNGNYATTGTTFARFNPTTSYISAGNVGIGTTSPNGKLDVRGTTLVYANTNISLYNSGGNALFHQFESYWDTNAAGSIATLRFDVGTWRLWSAGTGAAVVTVKSDGNVGIGTTSPNYPLHVKGGSVKFESQSNLTGFFKANTTQCNISFEDTTNGSNDIVYIGSIGNNFIIATTYNERVRVNGSGNLGIATTNPTAKLHVNGTVRLDNSGNAFTNAYTPAGGNTVSDVVGNNNDSRVLGTPDIWLRINIGGTNYVFPGYTEP